MNKKTITSFVALVMLFMFFSFSSCFATNSVENSLKNAASNVGGAIKTGVDATKNTISDAKNKVEGAGENLAGNMQNSNKNNVSPSNGYTAIRTSTGNATIAGMSATTWTWIIMAILGIAIVAMVWFYGKQYSNNETTTNIDNE